MTRETMMAIQQGVAENLRENLTFFKATDRLDDANMESVEYRYEDEPFSFSDDTIAFDIKRGDKITPITEWYRGNDVITGFKIQRKFKMFVDEISDSAIRIKAREVIADYMAKETGRYIGSWMIDCKLSKLYLEEKITWEDYVENITGNC